MKSDKDKTIIEYKKESPNCSGTQFGDFVLGSHETFASLFS
jgi:hypothetical protein